MNIAIILSVSEYQNTSCLPGCVLDGQLIKSLLDETSKYKEILFINQETDSIKVKEKLSIFITNNQAGVFDEVFFYYTGHGDFRDNEFYYILSDFDTNSYRQTSLCNSELDNFLRQLNPKLTIKIIDACHSGLTYIKDNDGFSKHLDESKQRFNNCYFMFSSMSDQASYQTNIISHFTKSFVDSVIKYSSTEIRYKHIVDYISDEFEKNAFQKPFFITQASFTENFCSVSQNMKILLSKQIKKLLETKSDDDELKELSLVNLIKKDAERYCSEEEALEAINAIKRLVDNYQHSPEFIELYEILSQFENNYKPIYEHIDSLGKWLKDNNNNYFSKVTYKKKLVSPKKRNNSITEVLGSSLFYDPDAVFEEYISGFDITVNVPFKLVNIQANPKYPNLDLFTCNIAFVFSPNAIRFFYLYSILKLEAWEDYTHDSSSDWQTIEVEIKNVAQLKEAVDNILNKFNSFVIDPLKAKYT